MTKHRAQTSRGCSCGAAFETTEAMVAHIESGQSFADARRGAVPITWHRGIGGGRFAFVVTGGEEWKLAEISGGACVAMRCIDRMPFSAGTVFDSTDEALAFLRVAR